MEFNVIHMHVVLSSFKVCFIFFLNFFFRFRYYLRKAHGSKRWIVYLEGKTEFIIVLTVLY